MFLSSCFLLSHFCSLHTACMLLFWSGTFNVEMRMPFVASAQHSTKTATKMRADLKRYTYFYSRFVFDKKTESYIYLIFGNQLNFHAAYSTQNSFNQPYPTYKSTWAHSAQCKQCTHAFHWEWYVPLKYLMPSNIFRFFISWMLFIYFFEFGWTHRVVCAKEQFIPFLFDRCC